MTGPAPAETGSLWRTGPFRTFWIGESISMLGGQVTALAIPLIAVITLQVDVATVGLLSAVGWLPFAFAILVGAWADRCRSSRRILVWAAVAQALLVATIPLAHWLGSVSLPQLYAVAFGAGVAAVAGATAYPRFFVALVPREQYQQANSLLSVSRSAASLTGPPLTGWLVHLLSAPLAMLVDAVSFLVAAAALGRIKVAEREPDSGTESLLARAWSGLRCIWQNRYLRTNLLCSTTLNLATSTTAALLVLFASRTLGLPPGPLGAALGAGAVGALLGSLIAAPIASRIGIGRAIALGAVLGTLPLAALPLATLRVGESGWGWSAWGWSVLALSQFGCAAGVMLYDINNNSVSAVVTPDAMRSRVSGAFSTINYGIRPLGALLGGLGGTVLGVQPMLIIGGVLGGAAVCWMIGSPLLAVRTMADAPDAGHTECTPQVS